MKKQPPRVSARKVFASNVRKVRRLADISQEELAHRCEMSRTYLSEIERELRNVSIDNMDRIAIALNRPLSDLVDPGLFAD